MMNIKNKDLLGFLKKNKGTKIDKKYILDNIDKFDFKNQDIFNQNALMYIIKNNKIEHLGFDKNDILFIMDKFDLNHCNKMGDNALMYIVLYNKSSSLGFTKDEILSILHKFDLSKTNIDGFNVLMAILYKAICILRLDCSTSNYCHC